MIQYDTIYLRAIKSWQNSQLSLAHGTETKIKEKLKTKTDWLRKNGAGKSSEGSPGDHNILRIQESHGTCNSGKYIFFVSHA